MPEERPNILLITTDQQRFDTIAALGNQEIYTPHLDWLVDEGISFANAYTDCPICMAARCTVLTGRNGYDLGVTGNGGMQNHVDATQTMPARLTRAGYQTRAQGKMHFAPMRCNYGFETMELPMDYYRDRHRRGLERLPKEHGVGENEMTPVISTVHETESLTHWTVTRSIDFLETRDDTRPFFMWTSFTKPHPPWDPCANYWSLYVNRDVSPPVHGDWSKDVADMPQGFMESTYCLNQCHRMTASQLQDAKRAYYACITHIDYELGLLFARMREMNLLENTWIIFTADHGEMLGDHHMGAKSTFLEGSAHVPMIVRAPASSWDKDKLRAGERVTTMAQVADITPTICNIAGVEGPPGMTGKDLLTLDGEDRPFFLSCGQTYFGVMRNRVKLAYAIKGGEELLFDLNDDPKEQHNLLDDPAYAKELKQLRTDLQENLAQYHPGLVKDGKIQTQPPVTEPNKVPRWPGYHSTVVNSDVLH